MAELCCICGKKASSIVASSYPLFDDSEKSSYQICFKCYSALRDISFDNNSIKHLVSCLPNINDDVVKAYVNNKIDPPNPFSYENRGKIIVTTLDVKTPYEIIAPVYFQVSNRGVFSSALSDLEKAYSLEIEKMKQSELMSEWRTDWMNLFDWSAGQNHFEMAFYISVEEMKKRAIRLKADAIVGMRQDIDIDTNGFAFFYLQMYGTAVRFLQSDSKGS
jgi:hypothetical protein